MPWAIRDTAAVSQLAMCSSQPELGAVCTSGGHGLSACSDTAFPMNFRVVEYFKQNPQTDGPRVLVQLREWTPDWARPGQCFLAGSCRILPSERRLCSMAALCCVTVLWQCAMTLQSYADNVGAQSGSAPGRHIVALCMFAPPSVLASAGVGESHPAALISPLPESQAGKLKHQWNNTAPKYLAW